MTTKPTADPATQLSEIRTALLAELGGPDAAPENATILDMIDALASMNRFHRNGWAHAQDRLRKAKRTLADNGVTTHTAAPSPESASGIPPAVRWVPDGGTYVFAPGTGRWFSVYPWGSIGQATGVPDGAEELVPISDAGHAIDFYRDQLRPEDRADGVPHAVARRHALAELTDAADLLLWAPSGGRESELTMEDLRRGYDC